jgi:hypothetical protein
VGCHWWALPCTACTACRGTWQGGGHLPAECCCLGTLGLCFWPGAWMACRTAAIASGPHMHETRAACCVGSLKAQALHPPTAPHKPWPRPQLQVCGLINIQWAIQDDLPYIIEANPRASRTVPFVAKAIGHPIAKYASLVMSGVTLKELNFTEEPRPENVSVKEVVLPFNKFAGELQGKAACLMGYLCRRRASADSGLPSVPTTFLRVSCNGSLALFHVQHFAHISL